MAKIIQHHGKSWAVQQEAQETVEELSAFAEKHGYKVLRYADGGVHKIPDYEPVDGKLQPTGLFALKLTG